jgi:hypothetical protein
MRGKRGGEVVYIGERIGIALLSEYEVKTN